MGAPDSGGGRESSNDDSHLGEKVWGLDNENVLQPEDIQLRHLPEEYEHGKLKDPLKGGISVQPVCRRPAEGGKECGRRY